MQRSVFAKEPNQLPLLVRIEAHLLAMIRDIKVSGTWLADLSVVDMFHQRFLLWGKRRSKPMVQISASNAAAMARTSSSA
jgi:hypothetical protein